MEQNLKACPKCNTINEINAKFCRNCGASLASPTTNTAVFNSVNSGQNFQPLNTNPQDEQNEPDGNFYPPRQPNPTPIVNEQPAASGYYYQQNPNYANNEIFGMDAQSIATFVGSKSSKYMPKFFKISNGKKTSWNTPVFLLSFFLGPIGTAFWFFHRRMNKLAALFLSIGILLTCCQLFIVGNVLNTFTDELELAANQSGYTQYKEYVAASNNGENPYFDEISNGMESFLNSNIEEIAKNTSLKCVNYTAIMNIISILTFAFSIIIAMFANYIYLKFAIQRIFTVKTKPIPLGHTSQSVLANAGGTKALGWLLSMIGIILLNVFSIIFIMSTYVAQMINILL